ncbi:hypothetical protein [Paenibacillus sp. GP183]|uniref:hypothetical protein n=1 Tax=Paenibacillus sp. GP183 TaxID=1882751 RepID=UPI000B1EBB46|nr:hypothetical protein [Paenibacillus sp. GP183]
MLASICPRNEITAFASLKDQAGRNRSRKTCIMEYWRDSGMRYDFDEIIDRSGGNGIKCSGGFCEDVL